MLLTDDEDDEENNAKGVAATLDAVDIVRMLLSDGDCATADVVADAVAAAAAGFERPKSGRRETRESLILRGGSGSGITTTSSPSLLSTFALLLPRHAVVDMVPDASMEAERLEADAAEACPRLLRREPANGDRPVVAGIMLGLMLLLLLLLLLLILLMLQLLLRGSCRAASTDAATSREVSLVAKEETSPAGAG